MDNCESQPPKRAIVNTDVDRDAYYRRLYEVFNNKKAPNSVLLSREKYNLIIEKIKAAKTSITKTPADYHRLKKYEIVDTPDGEKLFAIPVFGDDKRQMYVAMDEMYDIITEYHINFNHAGRSRLMVELKRKYKNITAESVTVYLKMCSFCKNKVTSLSRRHARRIENISKSKESIINETFDSSCDQIPECSTSKLGLQTEVSIGDSYTTYKSPELCSRGQVDILGVANEDGDEYKYLMVYRNFISKYTHLKPMKSLSVEEPADALLEIFMIFGAPNILQSKNGQGMAKAVCRRISNLCPKIKMVASESLFTKIDFKGKSNEDILKMLNDWLLRTQDTKWQQGVKFVQHELNTTFHEVLCKTPSEMIFGENPKYGLASIMSKNAYEDLSTEEDLQAVLENKDPIAPKQLKLDESIMLPSNFIKLEAELEDENEMDDDLDDDDY